MALSTDKMVWVEFVKHDEQRYDTVGDYYVDSSGNVTVKVTEFDDPRYSWLIAIHEIIEMVLARYHNITDEEIDEFDLAYTKSGEPGDDANCPYRYPHLIATGVERILAAEMNVEWEHYEAALNAVNPPAKETRGRS